MSDGSTPSRPYRYTLRCGHTGCTRRYICDTEMPYVVLAYTEAEKDGWVRLQPPDLGTPADPAERFIMCPDHAGEAL